VKTCSRGPRSKAKWFYPLSQLGIQLAVLYTGIALSFPGNQVVTKEPPMGWNSYDAYHGAITEDQFRKAVDVLSKKLLPFGYNYVVIDYCWFDPGPKDWNPERWQPFPVEQNWNPDGSFSPILAMDRYGRFLPAENRFASASNGRGFKAIADYVHSRGMKFGIHIIRGIPRQAVAANTSILGTKYHARDVIKYSPTSWTNTTQTVDVRKPGAQEYYDSIFKLYASWGVDLVKADNMMSPVYQLGEIEMMHKAIQKSGRPIVLSLSWGGPPMSRASHLMANANMWRISGDFWDRWSQVKSTFDRLANWSPFAGAGHWPDADMLPIGLLCLGGFPDGEKFPEHLTQLSDDEIKTLMLLWSIARSPLIWGGDPIRTPDSFYKYLTNRELIEMNQHGTNPRQVFASNNTRIWVSDIPNSQDKYLVLFNLDDEKNVDVTFDFLWEKMCGPYRVHDMWSGKDAGISKEIVTRPLAPHSCAALRLKRVSNK
jgi:alpha-galactosidase